MNRHSGERTRDGMSIERRGRRVVVSCGLALAAVVGASAAALVADEKAPKGALPHVTLVEKAAQTRVDVLVDGKPFTSYIWPPTLKKPVLHPIRTAEGVVVTRGFPPETGERADHPHHVGLWFNYGDVNGYDFWNNSTAITGDRVAKMGTVSHREITKKENGKGKAELGVKTLWVTALEGRTLLEEETTFTFHASSPGLRIIDRETLLRPIGAPVAFKDNKEGMLGLRVRRALEDPNEKSGEFRDAAGNVTKMSNMDTTGVTGVYTSSEGKTGAEVWGTRGRWTMLAGKVEGRPVTIAILDHPGNPGHPTYWHARGYGLFAANPLGQAAFTEGRETLNFSLPANQSQLFRYRIAFFDSTPSAADIEKLYAEWTGRAQAGSR